MKNKFEVRWVNEEAAHSSWKCDVFSKKAATNQPFIQKFKHKFVVCGSVNKGCL